MPVELRWIGVVAIDLARGWTCHHDVAHRERRHPEPGDVRVCSGVDLVCHVGPPGIGEGKVNAAAHLRHIREDVRPESVIAREVRALIWGEMVRKRERAAPLPPVAPSSASPEPLAYREPSASAGRDDD